MGQLKVLLDTIPESLDLDKVNKAWEEFTALFGDQIQRDVDAKRAFDDVGLAERADGKPVRWKLNLKKEYASECWGSTK